MIEALDVQTAYRPASIDQADNDSDGAPLAAGLGADDVGLERSEVKMAVEKLLETLPERERRIVELRFFEDLSQSEIAERVGISQMHVSRLLRRSLEALREHLA